MAKVLIIAETVAQARAYADNMGFKLNDGNHAFMTPYSPATGFHPDEIWIVGTICIYYEFFINQFFPIKRQDTKVFIQSELPNQSGLRRLRNDG